LCVIDKVPRELRPEQKQALRILARHVMSQLELRRQSKELTRARQEGDQAKGELEKLKAELAEARRQLAEREPKPLVAVARGSKPRRPRSLTRRSR
jgi:hypothetical protein